MEANSWFVAAFTIMLVCNLAIIFIGLKEVASMARMSEGDSIATFGAAVVGWAAFTSLGLACQFQDPFPKDMESFLLSSNYMHPVFVIAVTLNALLFVGGVIRLSFWLVEHQSWDGAVVFLLIGFLFIVIFGTSVYQQAWHPRFSPNVLKAKQKLERQYFEAAPPLPPELPSDKPKCEKLDIVEESNAYKV